MREMGEMRDERERERYTGRDEGEMREMREMREMSEMCRKMRER